jgi:hypothetical protein
MRILLLGFIIRSENRIKDFASKLHLTIKVLAGVYKVSLVCDSKEFYF